MTAKELSQLYHINREIEQDKRRLAEMESIATSATARITGLPHINSISDKTAIAAEIADIQTEIDAKMKLCIVEYNRLMRYIFNIDDSLIRQIFSLRHINGFGWHQVAASIGGGNTADSVRMAHKRYLESCSFCSDDM